MRNKFIKTTLSFFYIWFISANDKKILKTLPIKPKPLLFPKQATVFRLFSTSYNNKYRKPSNTTEIQVTRLCAL